MYVPADPHEAYAFGVRQATEPLYATNSDLQYPHDINKKLLERRENLLTRKVTKWVAVYQSPSVFDPAAVAFGFGRIYDSEAEALPWGRLNTSSNFLGVYPIEIRVPY